MNDTFHDFEKCFRNKRVLITGGLGFIGSNLARRLVDFEAEVLLVDSLVPEYGGNWRNIEDIRDRVSVNISDVRDPYSMRYLVQGKEFLFNLAGQTSHMDSMSDPFTDLETNCRAQLSILEACRLYNPTIRIVFASTRQLYGKPDQLPVDESHLLRPVDVNGVNKMAGEWYHILYHNTYGIQSTALRLTNTFGPRMRIKDARQTFLGVWIKAVIQGHPFEVWDGSQVRDFTYVDDAVEAFLQCATHPSAAGAVYNLGGDKAVTLRELAAMLIAANDGQGEFLVREFPADRKRIDIGDYWADDRRIRTSLGWQPSVSADEGLRRTLAYYHQNLSHYL